jgi:hypothetical protein
MLHVLNGDATATVFADAGLPGERLVWRDIVIEGPVPAAAHTPLPARTTYLAERLGIDPAEYTRAIEEQTGRLASATSHDEVVLWFEQDLFCAVTLWSLLDWLARHAPATHLSLVYPTVDGETRGLGAMTAPQLTALFSTRAVVTDEMRALGVSAWAAYASPEPLTSPSLHDRAALPFVDAAFRCHLGRFPSAATGLNEVETVTLETLRAGRCSFGELFREVNAHPRVRPHGMGDTQFAAILRGLPPLVDVAGDDVMQASFDLTPRGAAVLAGQEDWLRIHAIDTWLGGVHLSRGRPLWRWNGVASRLVGPGP